MSALGLPTSNVLRKIALFTETSSRFTFSAVVHSIPENFKPHLIAVNEEFASLEYRVKEGLYEINTPGDDNGILIYRVNTNYNGNANGPPDGLYLYRYGGTSEASGSFGAAVFSQETGRTKFNDTTNPSCFLTDASSGGINISYVGEDLETIEFAITNLILVSQIDGLLYDTDEDGNINPGEEIIINLSLANFSDGINASNITTTLSSDDDIIIHNPTHTYNETLEYNEIIYESYMIDVGENISFKKFHFFLSFCFLLRFAFRLTLRRRFFSALVFSFGCGGG